MKFYPRYLLFSRVSSEYERAVRFLGDEWDYENGFDDEKEAIEELHFYLKNGRSSNYRNYRLVMIFLPREKV